MRLLFYSGGGVRGRVRGVGSVLKAVNRRHQFTSESLPVCSSSQPSGGVLPLLRPSLTPHFLFFYFLFLVRLMRKRHKRSPRVECVTGAARRANQKVASQLCVLYAQKEKSIKKNKIKMASPFIHHVSLFSWCCCMTADEMKLQIISSKISIKIGQMRKSANFKTVNCFWPFHQN